jgi:hypothetical protein
VARLCGAVLEHLVEAPFATRSLLRMPTASSVAAKVVLSASSSPQVIIVPLKRSAVCDGRSKAS